MVILIDADSIIYKAGFSNEERYYHIFFKDKPADPFASVKYMKEVKMIIGDSDEMFFEKEVVVGPLENHLHSIKMMIKSIQDACKCYDIQVFLSSKGKTIKHSIAKTYEYKGNRDPEAKPKLYEEMRRYIEKKYNAISYDGYEADDLIYSYAIRYEVGNCIIASIDKDLQLIPGEHYNYSTGARFHVTKEEAEENFWTLMLTGDVADNIKGIPKIGPKTAYTILLNQIDKESVVKNQYYKEFGSNWEERYNENFELIKLHNIFK